MLSVCRQGLAIFAVKKDIVLKKRMEVNVLIQYFL